MSSGRHPGGMPGKRLEGAVVAKSRGRQSERKLADMTIPPPLPIQPAEYGLPDPDETEEVSSRVALESGHELYVRFVMWRDRLIVEFAIGQIVRHNGRWVEVARIDTCHLSIHRHQLKKSEPGNTVGEREILEEIPPENPWAVVDQWYERSLKMMEDDWTETLRRWRHG